MSQFEKNIKEFEILLEREPITKLESINEEKEIKKFIKSMNIECDIFSILGSFILAIEVDNFSDLYKTYNILNKKFENYKIEKLSKTIYITYNTQNKYN